jgi:DNA-binding MarR family transcriptional regulator
MKSMEISETLFYLIPLLEKNFIRPVFQQSKMGFSPMQIHTMVILKEKNASTMTALANEMLMSKQQMTPIIDKLVSQGFVQREHDLTDRRLIKINLSSSGLQLLEDIKKDALQILNAKLESLDKDDLLCWNNALTDLYKIVQKLP